MRTSANHLLEVAASSSVKSLSPCSSVCSGLADSSVDVLSRMRLSVRDGIDCRFVGEDCGFRSRGSREPDVFEIHFPQDLLEPLDPDVDYQKWDRPRAIPLQRNDRGALFEARRLLSVSRQVRQNKQQCRARVHSVSYCSINQHIYSAPQRGRGHG